MPLSRTLLAAFDEAVAANKETTGVDSALIETGRAIASSIDEITASKTATATEKTKALYLTPHLVAILRELLATPAARKQFKTTIEQKSASRLELIKKAAGKAPKE
jgi:hypothetical protein